MRPYHYLGTNEIKGACKGTLFRVIWERPLTVSNLRAGIPYVVTR